MSTLTKATRTALAVAGLSAALAACGSSSDNSSSSGSSSGGSSSGKDYSIAYVSGNSTDPFWTTITCGATQEAKQLGANLKSYASATLDTKEFTQNFTTAMLAKPDGIMVNPLGANQYVTQYKQLMGKGVPVVTGNATQPPAQYKLIWSSGDTSPYLSQAMKLIPKGSGSMAVIAGVPGLIPEEQRFKPFVAAVAKAGYKQLPTQYTSFDVNKATTAARALLLAHPDLKVIVASDGPNGTGVAAAVKAAGKAGQVTVIAFDAVPTEIQALKAGTITGLIAQSPLQIGEQQVKAIVDYLKQGKSGTVPASSSLQGVPQRLLTKANVDAPANADYIYKTSC